MKKFVLLFVILLSATGLHAAQFVQLKPGQAKTITLEEPYFSSRNLGKAVAFSSGRGSRDVTIRAQRAGSTEIAFFSKTGGLIQTVAVTVGGAKKETHTKLTPAASKSRKKVVRAEPVAAPEAQPSYNAWHTLKNLFPGEHFQAQTVGNSIALTGTVSDATVAAQMVQAAGQLSNGKPVLNMLQLKSGQQVMLRVRIGEVQRGAMDQLGLSAQGVVGSVSGLFYSATMYDVSTRLDFLSQNGLMKVLAEPNLTAISGEKATFLAGGEFPITVPQKGGDVFTVEYKPFGVGINFTPTVLAGNRIRLAVEPEVSEISSTTVSLGGAKVPTLSTRRAKTTVELAPGESFMIAGLISDNMKTVSDEIPVAGDVPVLGALFRSTAFKRNETELVIAVTPYLVDPIPSSNIVLPTDNFRAPSVLEQSFFGALSSKPNILGATRGGAEAAPAPSGAHGFMTE